MAKIINLELLSSVKSGTQAFLETRKLLSLTPVEKNLLGIQVAPEVVNRSYVQLKCGFRSSLNDKRRAYGMPDLEPQQDSLPWGEWEIEDAIIRQEDANGVHRFLRYYEEYGNGETSHLNPVFIDTESGEVIKGVRYEDILSLIRRRNKSRKVYSTPKRIVDVDHITKLYTIVDGERDLTIIDDQLD